MPDAGRTTSIIGKPQTRIDGPLKVSGRATYTSDENFPGMLYAVPVGATVAKGSIASLSTTRAEGLRGVRAIYHHGNIGKLYRTATDTLVDEQRPPFEDQQINYYGQYVAVVIADTFEQAKAAADAVEVTYFGEPPLVNPYLLKSADLKDGSNRGDSGKAFTRSPVQVDEVYVTPAETHAAIELHATVAVWKEGNLTLYDTVQGVTNHQEVMRQRLGIEKENARVITKYLGSGFGGKTSGWSHCSLAAVAARRLNRPVKLVLSRRQVFEAAGHRPQTEQRIRLGANRDGKLLALEHHYASGTSMLDDFTENCGEATPYLYSVPHLSVKSGLVRRTVGAATWMRGPGAVPGLFALESAMDELAIRLDMDPVALRHVNEPAIDEDLKIPFSSRHLTECLNRGAERFGWSRRTPGIGSMKAGGVTLGWGVACCSWLAGRFAATAAVELRADGSARVASGTQDIGTGTYTVLAQLVSERCGITPEKVTVAIGDSALPAGPLSGGSMVTASMVPAVFEAADKAIEQLLANAAGSTIAQFHLSQSDDLAFTNGRVHVKSQPVESGLPFAEVLQRTNLSGVSGVGKADGKLLEKNPKLSLHCYGAQFVEVGWCSTLARLRVNRVVTVIDSGRIVNAKTARNQIEGAVVMGVGMALFEETSYDQRNGAPINSNLADYIVPTHADCPEIDVHFLEYPDLAVNELGAKGIGEIGLAGLAPAIANAVYHATGVRVRKLPIRIEDLLGTNFQSSSQLAE